MEEGYLGKDYVNQMEKTKRRSRMYENLDPTCSPAQHYLVNLMVRDWCGPKPY